ncbi:hypothetical protein [Ascidiimonas sp. W6]|uniref:hypothetical protein n=1 Tax=Ascidiimonas meishanensis TaxID=3128903 RepID=UPI0030EBB320
MKKLNVFIRIFIGLLIFSCVSDDDNSQPISEANKKRLIKLTKESDYQNNERYFFYDSDNNVTNIKTFSPLDQSTPDVFNIIFNYENNLIISSSVYKNQALIRTIEYNYLNDNLTEMVFYDANGIKDDKLDFLYNSENRVDSIYSHSSYIENDSQRADNFTYNTNGNIVIAEGYFHRQFQYDTNPTPSNNFTNANKIIFAADSFTNTFCENNQIKCTLTTYREGHDPYIRHINTSIIYDADDYPIHKTIFQTKDDGTVMSTETMTFEYE